MGKRSRKQQQQATGVPSGAYVSRQIPQGVPQQGAPYGRPRTFGMGNPAMYSGASPAPQPQVVYVQQPAQQKKRRGAAFWIVLFVALVAIVIAILLALSMCSPQKAARTGDLGQLEGKTAEEIQAELDRVVAEGMFNISIASVVEFENGRAPGELRIENVPNNNYLMQVEIVRQDTGEKLYETGVIEPNHHIQADTLDVVLPKGSYDCMANFTALDPETEEKAGEVAAQITLNVLS